MENPSQLKLFVLVRLFTDPELPKLHKYLFMFCYKNKIKKCTAEKTDLSFISLIILVLKENLAV